MPFHPGQSREAHSQIGLANRVAVSNVSRCSVAPGAARATPRQHSVRGADAGQPFPLAPASGVVGLPLRPRHPHSRPQSESAEAASAWLLERLSGPPVNVVIEPIHDHPQARFLIGAIALALLIAGIAIQFA